MEHPNLFHVYYINWMTIHTKTYDSHIYKINTLWGKSWNRFISPVEVAFIFWWFGYLQFCVTWIKVNHPNTNLNRIPCPVSYVTINKDVRYDLLRTRNTISQFVMRSYITFITHTILGFLEASKKKVGTWEMQRDMCIERMLHLSTITLALRMSGLRRRDLWSADSATTGTRHASISCQNFETFAVIYLVDMRGSRFQHHMNYLEDKQDYMDTVKKGLGRDEQRFQWKSCDSCIVFHCVSEFVLNVLSKLLVSYRVDDIESEFSERRRCKDRCLEYDYLNKLANNEKAWWKKLPVAVRFNKSLYTYTPNI